MDGPLSQYQCTMEERKRGQESPEPNTEMDFCGHPLPLMSVKCTKLQLALTIIIHLFQHNMNLYGASSSGTTHKRLQFQSGRRSPI